MEVSLRGLGTTVQNPDGTISVVIDPNAGSITPTTTQPSNTINYTALGIDPVVADGAGGLCPASQLVNNLCPAGESCAVTGDCYIPSTGSPTSTPLSTSQSAATGTPTTTLLWIGVAIFAVMALGGRR